MIGKRNRIVNLIAALGVPFAAAGAACAVTGPYHC